MHKGNQSVVLPLGTQVFDLLVLFGKNCYEMSDARRHERPVQREPFTRGLRRSLNN